MTLGTFIHRLPSDQGTVPVTVAEGDITHAEAWDRDIQKPFIDSTDRIDAGWSWRTNYLRCSMAEVALLRHLAFLRVVTATATGESFTVGQMLLSDGYPYPPDRSKPCVFLWYLAGAPSTAATAFKAPKCKAVLASLVDSALQFSHLRGYGGRLCLHASPQGSAQQKAELMERYKQTGLKRLGRGIFIGPFRRNDGRYFYADEQLALKLSAGLDALR